MLEAFCFCNHAGQKRSGCFLIHESGIHRLDEIMTDFAARGCGEVYGIYMPEVFVRGGVVDVYDRGAVKEIRMIAVEMVAAFKVCRSDTDNEIVAICSGRCLYITPIPESGLWRKVDQEFAVFQFVRELLHLRFCGIELNHELSKLIQVLLNFFVSWQEV